MTQTINYFTIHGCQPYPFLIEWDSNKSNQKRHSKRYPPGSQCIFVDNISNATRSNKYVETHKKTRRVGRHRYVSDGIRKEYYLQVAFENGAVEELHVSLSTYNKAKAGASKILTLQKGFFGLPVITKGL